MCCIASLYCLLLRPIGIGFIKRDGKKKKHKETAEKGSKDFVHPFHCEADVYWSLYRSGLFYRISVYI